MIKKQINIPYALRNKRDTAKNLVSSTVSSSASSGGGSWLEQYFTYNSENDTIRINKTFVSDYDLIAYADSGQELPSIFDNLPKASVNDFGIVKVGTGINVNAGVISIDNSSINPTLNLSNNVLSVNASTIDLSGLQTDLSNYYTSVQTDNLLTNKANTSHTHTIANVTNLQTSLDNKSNVGHIHTIANITNLTTELNGKANSSHTHSISNITNLQTSLNNKLDATATAVNSTKLNNQLASYYTDIPARLGYTPLNEINFNDLFEAVKDTSGNTQYIRAKYTLASDYDVIAYTDSGQNLPTIFDNLPKASATSYGVTKIGNGINVVDGVISIDNTSINPTLSFINNVLSVNGSSVNLSDLQTDLSGYYTSSTVDSLLTEKANKNGSSTQDFTVKDLTIHGTINHWLADTITVEDANLQLNAVQSGARVNSGLIISNNDTGTELSKLYYGTSNSWVIDGNKIITDDKPIIRYDSDTSYSAFRGGIITNAMGGSNISSYYVGYTAGSGWYKLRAGYADNADKVDGLQAYQFLRSDESDTMNGTLSIVSDGADIEFGKGRPYYTSRIEFYGSSIKKGSIEYSSYYSRLIFNNHQRNTSLSVNDELEFSIGTTKHKVWHAGNDGGGSGLNADLLDGLNSDKFLRSDTSDIMNGNLTTNNIYSGYGSFSSVKTGVDGFRVDAGNGRGLRFWDSNSYKIYMSSYSDASWGGGLSSVGDYNMYFRMTGTGRGFVFKNSSTSVAQIDGTGNIIASGDVTAYSDARLKKNIKSLTNQLDKVLLLNPVSFTKKDDKNNTKKLGLIAQELRKIYPEFVQGEETDDSYLSVNYASITAVLIQAIKELKQEIDELKQ